MKKLILILSLLFFFINISFSDPGKARFHVIIDTDCALDDLRAICLMLASPDFEILGITTCGGILTPKQGYIKVKSLLREFGHEGIPVAYGRTSNSEKTEPHSLSNNLFWADEQNIKIPKQALAGELIKYEINNEKEKVIIISLGSLTNIHEIIEDVNYIKQIDKVLWYCEDVKNNSGFNYELDPVSSKLFLDSELTKYILSNNNLNSFAFDNNLLKKISNVNNNYSKRIFLSHNHEDVLAKITTGYYRLWDDILPLFLIYPELFKSEEIRANTMLVNPVPGSAKNVKECFIKTIKIDNSKENQVFNNFPLNPELFADDIKGSIQEIINRYGKSEWRAGVLTNELHGHLGIYAIIGVKMGVRARQYFNIGIDDVNITSFAGSQPPVSCLNDGLQVSTGGTLGHGLITMSAEKIKRPEAIFQFKNRKVKLKLKSNYWQKIRNNVKEGISKYGNLSSGYWQFIRKLAIKYWRDMDRMEIFEISEL